MPHLRLIESLKLNLQCDCPQAVLRQRCLQQIASQTPFLRGQHRPVQQFDLRRPGAQQEPELKELR